MKKVIILCSMFLMGHVVLFAQTDGLDIAFKHEISLKENLNGPTIYFAQIDNHVLIYDAHVSNRTLVCVNAETGKKEWVIEKLVHNFYIYEKNIVVEFSNYIAVHDLKTGAQIWRTDSGSIDYKNLLASEVSEQLLINYHGKKSILNLKTHKIDSSQNNLIPAQYFKVDAEKVNEFVIGVQNEYQTKHDIISFVKVESFDGLVRDYIWSLNKKKRIFYIDIYNKKGTKIKSDSWYMDEDTTAHTSVDYFSGYPEPEKLSYSVHVLNNKLFLYENYVNYRWSWGRGSNRLHCIDIDEGTLLYEKWGHAPSDTVEYPSNKFHFFDQTILYANNTMNFQDGDGKFWNFDEMKGRVLDSLNMENTLFRNYDQNNLLAFTYERKLIGESEYTNAVEMRLYNIKKHTFSKTFRFEYVDGYPYDPTVFPELGLIVFSVFQEDEKRSVQHVYKLTE